MARKFFTSWALWQKMVFVLACCLLLTIFAGLIKLWYTINRKKRFAALEKLADTVQVIREKSIIRSLSTKKSKPERRTSARKSLPPLLPPMGQIPFGIRALEEGAQVEEVWDSRPNSRETSRVDLYRRSNTSTTDLVKSNGHPLEQRDNSDLTSSTGASAYAGTNGSAGHGKGASSPERDASSRNRYPPHSFARYEGTRGHRTTNSFSRQRNVDPRSLNATDGPQSSQSASTFLSTSSNPGSDCEHGAPEYQMRSTRSHASSIRSSSVDSISAMQQRRLSQCAETGQILPRLRSDTLSIDSSMDVQFVNMARRERRMSFEMDESGEDSDSKHFSTPSIRVTANTPQPRDSSASSGRRERIGRRLRRRSTPNNTPPASPVAPNTPSSTFSVASRRSPEVLRQINPGFAVLKPGSLESSPVRAQHDGAADRRSTSLESMGRKGRRLQKRRPSEDSARSRGRSQ